MNETVARIVEIIFQDTFMTDEVQALKDEVMNNCQERYQDLIARGLNEDEAIAAVVESLKGMEEVIAQYPRKTEAYAQPEADEEMDRDLLFDPKQVKCINVMLTSDDVNFELSGDELVHVYYDAENMPNLRVEMSGEVLKIYRDNKAEVRYDRTGEQESEEQDWNSFSGFMNGIKKILGNIHINMQYGGGGEVTIAMPEEYAFALDLHTTSGDVDIDEVNVSELRMESTSGDLLMVLLDDVIPGQIKVRGSSGDVDITANTPALTVQTVSGDVAFTGNCPEININTVSGDAELNGGLQNVNTKTVSGDVILRVKEDTLRNVNANTTSGDLKIWLPDSMRGQVGAQLQTVSGTKINRFGEPLGMPVAYVNVNSISGDVKLF